MMKDKIRRFLLKLLKGVPQEVPQENRNKIIIKHAPIVTLRVNKHEPAYLIDDDFIQFAKEEMAQELKEKMLEDGLINFIIEKDSCDPEYYIFQAEIKIVKQGV